MEQEYWQADIVFMENFVTKNKGFKYFLLIVDVFTRKAQAQAKRKAPKKRFEIEGYGKFI
jgi:hypothetical protein